MMRARGSRARAGFTLLEVLISLTLLSVLGYAVMLAVGVGHNSRGAVEEITDESQSMRSATNVLFDDLRAANAAHVSITSLPDGNHSVRLQSAIEVGGVVVWGVHERELGHTAAEQDLADWVVRYTVVDVPVGGGVVEKQLVRQVLDAGGSVQLSRVLVRDLRAGGAVPPGFRLVQVGDVWEVSLSTVGIHAGQPGMRMVFHVQNRNESS